MSEKNKELKSTLSEKKKNFYSNTVCNFCKYNKLSNAQIQYIEQEYCFIDVCSGCKREYKMNKYI